MQVSLQKLQVAASITLVDHRTYYTNTTLQSCITVCIILDHYLIYHSHCDGVPFCDTFHDCLNMMYFFFTMGLMSGSV